MAKSVNPYLGGERDGAVLLAELPHALGVRGRGPGPPNPTTTQLSE